MKSAFYEPGKACLPLVKQYYFIQMDNDDESYFDKFIPDGTTAAVFNFYGRITYIEHDFKAQLPPHFIIIPRHDYVKIKITPPVKSMIIIFNTSVFSRIFGIAMEELTSQPYHVLDIFHGIPMMQDLAMAENCQAKIQLFEKYIQSVVLTKPYIPDKIDHAVKYIEISGGTIPVEALYSLSGFSDRTFRRYFLQRIGLSAKSYSRLIRMNYIWKNVKTSQQPDFQNMVYDGNYFDQSHFIKDIHHICGESPGSFFKRNLKQVKLISGHKG